ncbi:MAG TPA: hypothetical protein VGM52_18685 [Herbaspirillum sp.]
MAIESQPQGTEQVKKQKTDTDPRNRKPTHPEDAVTDKNGQSKPTPEKEPDPELDIEDKDPPA